MRSLKFQARLLFHRIGISLLKRNASSLNSSHSKYWELIENYTVISQKHLTPEIKLKLITQECQAWNQPVEQNSPHPLGEPFWAFYWPGGQALSRYILDNPLIAKRKRVLDFGCGSGALSIAALKSGAKFSVANDIDTMAIAASQLNAQINAVELNVCEDNLIGSDCADFDLILVGDMLYDSALSDVIAAWLMKLRLAGKVILVGDPGRGPVDNYGFLQSHVFTLL
ncbi:electron transfer flavoprotein beta subunit lysine methyltransferase-like isoform X2 [Daphnia pulex]|uniref:electron transfer flavoprotein beta subunit lysine methyltransferase-like isoform X2 n=1 Tax=Daphnia pulex TaxID=6669 RepID=UPI001EE0365F|nr:electron transfer flavoprotein beta subunit lysine methyltransferase-like isoform X2 [Daphnia pulex]